jgi:hypothetical protein
MAILLPSGTFATTSDRLKSAMKSERASVSSEMPAPDPRVVWSIAMSKAPIAHCSWTM